MTRRLLFAFVAVLFAVVRLPAQAPELTVMAFNIRYAHTTPPNLWPDRREAVRRVILDSGADIIGMQEALWRQVADIDEDLPDDFEWIGEGRDGGSRGEYMAVFYKASRFEPIEYDHFWLSANPGIVGSRVDGACCPRMVTWVRFRDIPSGQEFYFVNTHFDNQSQAARELGSALLLERVSRFDRGLPVIVTGDFNAAALRNPVYDALVTSGAFSDTWTVTEEAEPTFGTGHGFRGPEASAGGARIDWILSRGPVEALDTEIRVDNLNGQYPSDHFPVTARVRLIPRPAR